MGNNFLMVRGKGHGEDFCPGYISDLLQTGLPFHFFFSRRWDSLMCLLWLL